MPRGKQFSRRALTSGKPDGNACNGCQRRAPNCHQQCTDYNIEALVGDLCAMDRRKEKAVQSEANAYQVRRTQQIRRRSNVHR